MSEIASISRDDISKLLERLRIELFRRSGWDSDGNPIHDEMFRHYNLPVFTSQAEAVTGDRFLDLTLRQSIEESGKIITDEEYGDGKEYLDLTIREIINLSDSEIINAFQGHSLIGALIKICDFGDLRKVKEFDLIPGAFDKKTIESYLEILEADTFDTKTPHCRSACTGLCMNGCTDTCTGACVGVCASCSENCVGGCHATCTGCASDCGTNCGVGCGAGCSGKSNACAGCYSSCTGCTACSTNCSAGCKGCSNQCSSSCLAGCYGSSGYNNTCGCGGSCTTGCGGKASSEATTTESRSMTFYHDKLVYGVQRAIMGNSIVMPKINDCDNLLTPTGIQPYWIDEDGNIFAQGETVRIAHSSNYNQLKNSGIKVTKSSKMRSVVIRAAAEKMVEVHVKSGSSFMPNDRKVSITVTAQKGSPNTLVLEYASTISIESLDGKTGLSDETAGVMINDVYVALPYSYHHAEKTKIKFINGNYRYTYKEPPVATLNYQINPGMTSLFCPHVYCYIGNTGTYCEYEKNPNVNIKIDGSRIGGSTIAKAARVSLEARSIYNIRTDGSFVGLDYDLQLSEYRAKLPLSQSDYITLYGDTDSLHNVFVCSNENGHNIIYKIPLTRHKYIDRWWIAKIPTRETLGFGSDVNGLYYGMDKKYKVPFGGSITINERQDFYLYPYRE